MATEHFILTALPHASDTAARFHVSLFVSPRLAPTTPEARLGDFRVFPAWARNLIDGAEIELTDQNGPIACRPRFALHPEIVDPELWQAVFPLDTPVRGQPAPAWQQLGSVNGKLYALVFKAANKSLLWYNVPAFKTAGVNAPTTWTQLTSAAKTLQASGTPAYSVGGSDGWTLTDLFENIYLRTFGPAKYNALSEQVIGNSSNLAGGTSGALTYSFNDSVTNAFGSPPKAAIVLEGDFVGGVITSSTKSKPGTGFNTAAFPAITPGANSTAVEIGGDLFVTFRDNPAIEAFVKFLATADAAKAWAKIGGFGTGNKNVSPSIYPDAITRATEAPIGKAKSVVFDMSDEQPASFGATTGQGEWGIFQQFLKSPSNVSGIQKKLEAAATAAYKKGK